jgi:hypothetical protein
MLNIIGLCGLFLVDFAVRGLDILSKCLNSGFEPTKTS